MKIKKNKRPNTIEEFKTKYRLKSDKLDDLILELYDHSQKHKWSKETFSKKSEDLKRFHSELFVQLNEWLIYFDLPIQHTITKAKKLLEKEVFASVIDVKENNYYNCKSKKDLIKYLNKNPHKKINKSLAKDEGYRIFLEHLH